jgi:Leucine-rich repeat (LRR) protein
MPKLSRLDLHENQLVGPLPNRVSGLLDLNSLLLQNNLLNGTMPSWLFTLPSLAELIIVGNQFIGEIGEFKSNSLQIIVMGDNKLHGPLP